MFNYFLNLIINFLILLYGQIDHSLDIPECQSQDGPGGRHFREKFGQPQKTGR